MTPWVTHIIMANAAVYVLMMTGVIPHRWAVTNLGFSAAWFVQRPWSAVTYMFVHGGFMHLLFNMIVLYFFGPPLERAWGSRAFLKYYFVAGLGGALFSLLFTPVVGARPVVGASGAIYGVMLAFAIFWPNVAVYIWGVLPVKAKWLVAGMAAYSLYATFTGVSGNVAEWAHLGGLVTGYVYLRATGRAPPVSRWLRS